MEEKERYELKYVDNGFDLCEEFAPAVFDTTKNRYLEEYTEFVDELNQQDKRIKELQQQLAENNEFFNAFACKDFDEFKDFISTFMLAPHEEQTLIRELKQQIHDFPNKIVEEIRKEIEFPLYVHPDFDEFECLFDIDKLLDTILKKYGGEDESIWFI